MTTIYFSVGNSTTIGKSVISFILKDQPDIEHIVARVEWTTLIFFATLFVIMKSLDRLGFLLWIGGEITSLIRMVETDYRYEVKN